MLRNGLVEVGRKYPVVYHYINRIGHNGLTYILLIHLGIERLHILGNLLGYSEDAGNDQIIVPQRHLGRMPLVNNCKFFQIFLESHCVSCAFLTGKRELRAAPGAGSRSHRIVSQPDKGLAAERIDNGLETLRVAGRPAFKLVSLQDSVSSGSAGEALEEALFAL